MNAGLWSVEGSRIDGKRVFGPRILNISNPFNGETVGAVSMISTDDVSRALRIAWTYRSTLTRAERGEVLFRAASELSNNLEEASLLISLESGLSKRDTRHEVSRVIDVLTMAASEVLQDDGTCQAGDVGRSPKRRRTITQREPLLGVIAAITPFNHPMNQVAHKVIPAIATNNRIVLKPSEKAPLSALYFADLLYRAGLPPAMFQVVVGNPRVIVAQFADSQFVSLLTFTGSVGVGKQIAGLAIYKRLILELGGNDPLIVMDDADVDRAAALAAHGAYANSGQRCTAVKRIMVHRSLASRFTDALAANTRRWVCGNPLADDTDVGTVIDTAAAERIELAVNDAVGRGARVVLGHRREGALYSPTILANVCSTMPLVTEETFGPVAPVITFNCIEEAIAIANGTPFGLSSGICSNRLDYIDRFMHELQVGSINVWDVPGYRTERTPFGGIKDSGLGHKEGVLEAMKAYTNIKTLSLPWGVS
ncbi:phosphonoacetaldehyde dehydrogenase [Bradyrhizobium jicamae]|uniref:Phosphonoacetaldehyde dehydrogenase n=1 Tax=Bradyrhizobium jicamae TaxID=280332 RepID=A0ABS5FAW8_9BRAD|nr:phosphonoacetaldehyde dehydrogenase [Bradyrhizobium jicamae]MBR0793933.1 phosphonoacetaldehyde dehydrogenase [Bradyrhizobium jicamae]